MLRAIILLTEKLTLFAALTTNIGEQKKILEKIAEKKNFHPTKDPQSWYSVSQKDFRATKVLFFFVFTKV